VDVILFDRDRIWRQQMGSMRNPWQEVLDVARVSEVVHVPEYSTIPYACSAGNIASIKKLVKICSVWSEILHHIT
jgi:hypothetical protein